MNAVLIIQYAQHRTRAWNFLSHHLKDVELTCLAEGDALQVLSVRFPQQATFLNVLDLLRDDIGADLKAAYWLESPSEAYHLRGQSAGWITDYSTI
jgi:hypothetical protein